MLYQEYKEKLYKRKKIYDGLWKFRFLILAVTLFAFALSGTLMGIKGVAYDFSIPSEMGYGEQFLPEAECIFGDVSFEYRAEGALEWSRERPMYAGNYECRTVTASVFGTTRVGKPHAFEILPKKVEVKVFGDSHRIGDDVVFWADLLYKDALQVRDYDVSRADGNFVVTFRAEDIAVFSEDGKDVTSSYEFLPEDKTLSVVKRPVTVTMPSAEIEYDGEEHSFADAQADDGLLPMHTFEVTADSFKEAGTHINSAADCRIFDEEGEDITDIYDVKLVAGNVDIMRRKLSVGAAPKDIVYDGQEHVYDSRELLDGTTLAGGHTLMITDCISGKNVGNYQNTANIAIYDGENDVTKNYDITTNFAPMKIVQRPVTVTTEDIFVEYSGEERTFGEVRASESTPLVEGHELKVTSPCKALYADVYQYAPSFEIVDEEGADITQNYAVTRDFGEITVTKRKIEVKTCSYERWYSGAPNIPSEDEAIISAENLLVGRDRFEIAYGEQTMIQANEDGYENAPDIKIVDADGKDVSDNYDATYSFGKIKVKRRKLHIVTQDATFPYDGEEHFSEQYAVSAADSDGNGLAEGEGTVIKTRTAIKNVSESGAENRVTVTVMRGSVDVTKNYIQVDEFNTYGKLSVTPRPLALSTASGTHIYDGQDFSLAVVSAEGLIARHVISATDISDVTTLNGACAPTKNVFKFKAVVLYGGEDVTQNYDIDYENVNYGTLEVTKRAINLATQGYSMVYDGKGHVFDEVSGELVSGHKVQATFPTFNAVVTSQNKPEEGWKIVDGGGEDMSGNYDVTWDYRTVEISLRPIKVRTGSSEVIYDGAAQQANSYELVLTDGNMPLADGQQLNIEYQGFTDVGSHTNEPAKSWSITADGETVTSNYTVAWEYGTLNIARRPIRIDTRSNVAVYNGKAQNGAEDYDIVEESGRLKLANGQSLSLTYDAWKDVGEYKNEPLTKSVKTEGGLDVTENYDILVVPGTVKIALRPLFLSTSDSTQEYKGENYTFDRSAVSIISDTSLADGHTLKVAKPFEAIDVDIYEIKFDFEVDDEDGADVTRNYQISYQSGTFTVTPRHISVRTKDATVFYSGKNNAPRTSEAAISNLEGLLVGGDEFELTYEDMTAANEDGYKNAPEIKIMAMRDGVLTDVTKLDYDVTTTWGTIIVKKRILNVTITKDKSLVYNGKKQGAGTLDGEYYSCSEQSDGEGYGLADGESLSVENSAALNRVGDKAFELQYKVSKNGGKDDTTNNYKIAAQNNGKLIIEQRPVTLTTATRSRKYDGTPLSDYTVIPLEGDENEGLVEGQELECVHTTDIDVLIDCGSVNNDFKYTIKITAGADEVTDCYSISQICGTLTVTQRELTLSTANTSVMYDATPHGFDIKDVSYGGDGLAKGEELKITFKKFTNVADVAENTDVYDKNEGYKIYAPSREGKDVTGNYNITVKFGTYEITRRTVTLTTGSDDIVYDGQTHSKEEYNVSGEIDFVDGHSVVKSGTESFYPSFEDVKEDGGAYPNTPIDGNWIVANGDVDVSNNYEITWDAGAILIKPRDMVIQIGSFETLYDASYKFSNEYTDLSQTKFADLAQTLTIKCQQFYSAGTYDNVLSNDVDNYTIKKNADGSKVYKRNYNIEWLNGKAVINPRKVEIGLKAGARWEWIYDGKCHTVNEGAVANAYGEYKLEDTDFEIKLSGDGMLSFHSILVKNFDNVTQAGEYMAMSGAFQYEFVVRNAFGLGDDVSIDYDITDNVAGTPLTIAKRKVSATSGDNTWVYTEGGKYFEHSATAKTRSGEEGLLEGHSLTVLSSTEVSEITDVWDNVQKKYTNVGTRKNEVTEYIVVDEQGIDRTSNYEVEWTPGELRVKSPIQVMVSTYSKRYDGKEATLKDNCESFIMVLPPDVKAQDVDIALVGSLTEPGELPVYEIADESVKASHIPEGNRLDFVGTKSVIIITPRLLTIKTATVSVRKSGSPIYGRDHGKATITGLLSGHELSYELNAVLDDSQDSVLNTVDRSTVKIVDENGKDVTRYYEIRYNEGTLSWLT